MSAALVLVIAIGANAQQSGATAVSAPECPDRSDTPSILKYTIERAYQAWRSNPSGELPPGCLLAAIAATPTMYSDAVVDLTLALADESLRRNPNEAAVLGAKLTLLGRASRYAEVGPTFDRLVAADTGAASLDAYKLAIAVAQRGHDTASMVRYLGAATTRFPKATQLAVDFAILRQVSRLRALIDTTKRAIARDPRRIQGYASLVSIYGNLNEPDSALAYVRVARARGVSSPTVVTSLESLVGVVLRRAQLQNAPDVWETTLPVAMAIDSTLSTPASKYLVALTISEIAAYRIGPLSLMMTGMILDPRTGTARPMGAGDIPPAITAEACPKIAELSRQIAYASERLGAGGNTFAPGTVPAILGALRQLDGKLGQLRPRCPS